jgi:hypothetical protein
VTKSIEHAPWPESLASLTAKLTEGTFQRMSEFRPDMGGPISRPMHTPIPTLKGAVSVGEADWKLLETIFKQSPHNVYFMPLPHLGRSALVSFQQAPTARRTNLRPDGTVQSRIVELQFVEHA